MPETETPAAPETPATPVKKSRAKKPAKDALEEIKKKYRLDEEVNLYVRGPDGNRLGRGPILDPGVLQKLAALDPTKDKHFLDWMLFQSGGGEQALKRSKEMWGDSKPEMSPEDFFKKFKDDKPETSVYNDELRSIGTKLKDKGLDLPALMQISDQVQETTAIPDLHKRFQALTALLAKHNIAPGKEDKVAVEIINNKFKVWIKNQLATCTRDRVHATSVYSRLIRGMDRGEAETKWKEMEAKRRREYIFGDQDSLKWDAFGFNRHWPGRNNLYEKVYDAVEKFLANMDRVQRYNSRLDAYNASVKEKNKTLPPDQQLPLRSNMNLFADIGKVKVGKNGDLKYVGHYPDLRSIEKVNQEIEDLPMRERVTQHVQYAGPKGARSKSAKLYSDENIDVVVPLTAAASIASGHPSWDVSSPEQLANIKAQGSYHPMAWTNYATGQHGHMEWTGTQAIPVFFHIKTPGIPEDLQRVQLMLFLDDLIDLQAPYIATIWKTAGTHSPKMKYPDFLRYLKATLSHKDEKQQHYVDLVRSIGKAMKVIKDWGQEFNPQDIVPDPISHHREKMQGKMSFTEAVKLRATQVVNALAE